MPTHTIIYLLTWVRDKESIELSSSLMIETADYYSCDFNEQLHNLLRKDYSDQYWLNCL